jgi:hypothetical protein
MVKNLSKDIDILEFWNDEDLKLLDDVTIMERA